MIFNGILGRFAGWLAAAAAAIAGYKIWERKQRNEGRDAERAQQQIADAQAALERRRTDQAIVSLGDAQLRDRLRGSRHLRK